MNIICKEECILGTSTLTGRGGALLTSILVMVMPKCAFCWAAYLSIFSSFGLVIAYRPWFVPVSLCLFLITLIKLLIIAVRRKNFLSFGLALLAGLLIVSQRSFSGIDATKIVALVLMAVAVLRNNFLLFYQQLALHLKQAGKTGHKSDIEEV